MNLITENIKYYRKRKGLTQKELAKLSDITQSALAKYENGKLTPHKKSLLSIANALEIPLELFFVEPRQNDETKIFSDDDYVELQEQQLAYLGSEEDLVDLDQQAELEEMKNEFIIDLYYDLSKCRQLTPTKDYKNLIKNLNDLLDTYENSQTRDEINLILNRISDFYNKINPADYVKIKKAPKELLAEKNLIKKYK